MSTTKTRPRGFIEEWNPRPETRALVSAVKDILVDNSDILPLTLRQIFYMLVSGYAYDKTERAYQRLCETMNKARRARYIDMNDIRDDGLNRRDADGWRDEAHLVDSFKASARYFTMDRQDGQERRLFVWCEAGGMLPQLASYCEDYGVSVLSSGGFDSVTTKHNLAQEIAGLGDVEILHIGDHDPSGVHMYSSLDEDLQAFLDWYGGDLEVTRLAVTPQQVDELGLPTAPPKKTDNRAFDGLTTQAEAIPPRTLRTIVTDAILARFDMGAYQEVLDEEDRIKASLAERLANL